MKTAMMTVTGGLAALFAGCCTLNQPDDRCGGSEARVRVGPGQLHVRPECLTVEEGQTVTLRLELAEGIRQVRTRPGRANLHASWLNGANDERGTIEITAPAAVDEGIGPCGSSVCEYKYEIHVEGVGTLDPRVRVTHRHP